MEERPSELRLRLPQVRPPEMLVGPMGKADRPHFRFVVIASTFALKVAFAKLRDVAIVFVLLDILRSSGRGAHWVLAYAWNPTAGYRSGGHGHIDIVGVLLLSVSFAALGRRGVRLQPWHLGWLSLRIAPNAVLPFDWSVFATRWCSAAVVVGLHTCPFLTTGGFRSARSARTCKASALMIRCLQRWSKWRLLSLSLGWQYSSAFLPQSG